MQKKSETKTNRSQTEEFFVRKAHEKLSDPLFGLDEIRDQSFKEQDLFVMDRSRYLAALCTRRAGKSNGLAIRFFRSMQSHPGAFHPYVSLTRDSAKNIMWDVLQEQAETFKINCQFLESKLTVVHPNGARLQLFGADMKNFIRRLKGIKTPGAAIDEAQEFGDHLYQLVDDVLGPALVDYEDSWLALTGTAGPVPRGYFYDVTELKKYGYSIHGWNLFQNPYLKNPQKFVDDLKQKKGWGNDNPTYVREYGGPQRISRWILDIQALLIKYDESKNHFDHLPPGKYNYLLGVDIGIRDADALAVLAWSDDSQIIYLVEEKITTGQDITSLSQQIEHFMQKYDVSKIVMDEGALGKKVAEEIRRRKQLPVTPADKSRKMENVAFLNDYLRLGNFKANKNSRFALDSYLVQIDYEKSTPDKIIVKRGYHSDIIDAVLYAFKDSPAFSYRASKPRAEYGSREWAKEQEDEMENKAEEYFQNQEDLQKKDSRLGAGW